MRGYTPPARPSQFSPDVEWVRWVAYWYRAWGKYDPVTATEKALHDWRYSKNPGKELPPLVAGNSPI